MNKMKTKESLKQNFLPIPESRASDSVDLILKKIISFCEEHLEYPELNLDEFLEVFYKKGFLNKINKIQDINIYYDNVCFIKRLKIEVGVDNHDFINLSKYFTLEMLLDYKQESFYIFKNGDRSKDLGFLDIFKSSDLIPLYFNSIKDFLNKTKLRVIFKNGAGLTIGQNKFYEVDSVQEVERICRILTRNSNFNGLTIKEIAENTKEQMVSLIKEKGGIEVFDSSIFKFLINFERDEWKEEVLYNFEGSVFKYNDVYNDFINPFFSKFIYPCFVKTIKKLMDDIVYELNNQVKFYKNKGDVLKYEDGLLSEMENYIEEFNKTHNYINCRLFNTSNNLYKNYDDFSTPLKYLDAEIVNSWILSIVGDSKKHPSLDKLLRDEETLCVRVFIYQKIDGSLIFVKVRSFSNAYSYYKKEEEENLFKEEFRVTEKEDLINLLSFITEVSYEGVYHRPRRTRTSDDYEFTRKIYKYILERGKKK